MFGMFGNGIMPGDQPQVPQMPQPQQPAPQQGGMFGAGGKKMDWAGLLQSVIGGYLAGRGVPMGGAILNQVHDRQMMAQQQAMQDAQYQRERMDSRDDFLWKQEHSAPDMTSYAKDLMAAGIQPGTPRFNELYNKFVEAKAASGGSLFGGLLTNPADGQQYLRPNLPPLGVEMDDPRQGGPSPQGSAGFPGPY